MADTATAAGSDRRKAPIAGADQETPGIGKGWVQGVALVMIWLLLRDGPAGLPHLHRLMPMPKQVVIKSGEQLFTDADITRGQEIFTARGLHEYGLVVGHGAYLGPDYTADYLRLATEDVAEQFRTAGVLDARNAVVQEFRKNRYDPDTGKLVFTDRQAKAFEHIQKHYAEFFGEPTTKYGLRPT